jgi:dCMP deaminase
MKKEKLRPIWNKIYMNLAKSLALRSSCARAHVGCVVVSSDNTRVLSVGYNGNYQGGPNCCDTDKPGACGCIHAEANALIKLDYNVECSKTLYTTCAPCIMCAKMIINAGIDDVIYLDEYRDRTGLNLLEDLYFKNKIKVDRFV